MKIEDAKLIPLRIVIEDLGGRYSHTDRQGKQWFFSVFRPDEETASMTVNEDKNTWHDFGLSQTSIHRKQGSGGDILDLICDYDFKDRRAGIPHALKRLEKYEAPLNVVQGTYKARPIINQPIQNKKPRYEILKIANSITFNGLKDELYRRRISLKLANLYLKQGHILDTDNGKNYTAFLFENDKGCYEVSIPNPHTGKCFKTCIGTKASSRILTNSEKTNSADVFEGFWDFLSWLEMKKIYLPQNHSYILNSTSLVKEACEKIIAFKETVKYIFLFMDNDEAGYQATHAMAAILEAEEFKIGSMEQFYDGQKDFSDFWMKKNSSTTPIKP